MEKVCDVMLKHPEERKLLEYVFDRESPDGAQNVITEQVYSGGMQAVKTDRVMEDAGVYVVDRTAIPGQAVMQELTEMTGQAIIGKQAAMPAPDCAGIVKPRKVWTAPRMYIIRS